MIDLSHVESKLEISDATVEILGKSYHVYYHSGSLKTRQPEVTTNRSHLDREYLVLLLLSQKDQ